MHHNIKNFKVKFNLLSLRERATVFICLMLGLYFLLDFFLIQNISIKKQNFDLRVKTAKEKIKIISDEENEIKNKILDNPKIKNKKDIDGMMKVIDIKDNEISKSKTFLIEKKDIEVALTHFYNLSDGVVIEKFTHKNVVDISKDDENIKVKILKYEFIVELYGTYFDISSYIKNIELSGIKIHIDSMVYTVESHPYANVTLNAFVLLDDVNIEKEDVGNEKY